MSIPRRLLRRRRPMGSSCIAMLKTATSQLPQNTGRLSSAISRRSRTSASPACCCQNGRVGRHPRAGHVHRAARSAGIDGSVLVEGFDHPPAMTIPLELSLLRRLHQFRLRQGHRLPVRLRPAATTPFRPRLYEGSPPGERRKGAAGSRPSLKAEIRANGFRAMGPSPGR